MIVSPNTDQANLDALHMIVTHHYAKFRAAGGSSSHPYMPFFHDVMARLKATGDESAAVISLPRADGSRGDINLIEVFKDMGFIAR